jgi:ferredoxin-type protein NapH
MNQQGQDGLLTTYRESWRRRGLTAWGVAAVLLVFYLTLYFTEWLTPAARWLGLSSKWYLYGALYTVTMIGGAVYYLKRHGNSRYNRWRIAVNVSVQIVLAFALPFVMQLFGRKDFYFSYLWPLKIEYLYPSTLAQAPVYIALYFVVASLVATPVLALLYGKRWYCSWVCGCGALANTFGDPWRHLSDKSTRAWRFERVSVHSVMVVAIVVTAIVGVDFVRGQSPGAFHTIASELRQVYGFLVGALLAGIVGVVVYPLLGPRIWCRNFCPMAAMLGLLQKVGRYRIRVKPDMCISCGNCSTYCEMGIDVRAYAQSNQDFTRASCVGCGMCAHVCPRGVLRLENRWPLP